MMAKTFITGDKTKANGPAKPLNEFEEQKAKDEQARKQAGEGNANPKR